MSKLKICLLGFFGTVGVALFVLGFVLGYAVFPNLIEDEINKSVVLEDGTKQYDRFVNLPFPLIFKIYLFNVTNPDDVMNGAKATVEEIGPYVYKQYRKKVDVHLTENEVEYNQFQYYEFDALTSLPYTEHDDITMLNAALQGVLQISEKELPGLLTFVNGGWPFVFRDSKTLFHKVTVGDILFNGYRFCKPEDITVPQAKRICKETRKRLAKTMVINEDESITFSFFAFKNEHHDGRYVVGTGKDDAKNLGNIYTWEKQKYVFDSCNQIKGTDSSIFPPHSTQDTVFDVFNTDICRSVKLPFESEVEYKGVSGYRNSIAKDTFDSPSKTPENQCYCIKQTRTLEGTEECLPDGFYDLFYCQQAPVILSSPHFLWANENYSMTVDGLNPDESKHGTFVDYEPNTGTPLRGAKRVQFNMIIRKINKLTVTENIKPAVIPLLWIEEGVELTDDLIDELKSEFVNKVILVEIIQWVLVGLGIVIFIATIAVFYTTKNKNFNMKN